MVKNLPSNAGKVGLIPGWGTKIPHAKGQLSLQATTTETHMQQGQPVRCKEDPAQPKKIKKKKSWLSHPNFSSSNSPAQKQLTGALKSEDGPGGCTSTSHRGEPQD